MESSGSGAALQNVTVDTMKLSITLCCLLPLFLLAACQPQKPYPGMRPSQQPAEQPEDPAVVRARRIERLLWQGDRALSRGRLLYPQADNAYDYFTSVLLVDPGNPQAQSGLQAILLAYLDMARAAAAESDYAEALTLLDRAARLDPDDMLVGDLRRDMEQQYAILQQQREELSGDLLLAVNPARLSRRDETLAEELAALAQTVRERDQMIVIFARNDAEGRWIYQKMREGVPGYLLRGDILNGPSPEIRLATDNY